MQTDRVHKVGLLGGTFNPVHMTHLHMAEAVRESCALDEIWFIPNKIPPHKITDDMLSAESRVNMLALAIEDVSYFQLCRLEIERSGPSYTVDTVKALKDRYPQIEFSFIIGADMVATLPEWHRIDTVVELVRFIGVGRPEQRKSPDHPYMHNVTYVETVPSHISSTVIRERIKAGKSVRFLVPEKVFQYIEKHRLYT
jgi:nicotinate-nucleotide adenylyltransferase